MAENLPEPESRKEQYLAKVAGMDTTIPEEPMSREEQYLNAIAQGGGGGGYVLPVASASTLGGVKVGENLSIDANGVLSAQGGSSVTVVQQQGTSQTDVMSQNAVSSMIFADPNYGTKVKIGSYANSGNACVVVGSSSRATNNGVALGFNAQAPYNGDIALGAESGNNCIYEGIVDVGTGSSNLGYRGNSNYRLISGVYDAQGDHDAVTLGQLNTLLAALDARITVLEGGSAPVPSPSYPYTNGTRTYYLYNGVEVYVNQTDPSQDLYYASDNTLAIPGGEWGDNGDGTVSYIGGGGSENPDEPVAPEDTEAPAEG